MSKGEGRINIAVLGNPNSGKSSVFNALTGQRQKVGNFPGVTVEKKSATLNLGKSQYNLCDLPGTYSLHPTSTDEKIVTSILSDSNHSLHPDFILYTLDYRYLEQQLLLYTQLSDLGIPMLVVYTMADTLDKQDIELDFSLLSERLNTDSILINTRNKKSIQELKELLAEQLNNLNRETNSPQSGNGRSIYYHPKGEEVEIIATTPSVSGNSSSDYGKLLQFHHSKVIAEFSDSGTWETKSPTVSTNNGYNSLLAQIHETNARFDKIKSLCSGVSKSKAENENSLSKTIDKVVCHKVFGPILFFLIMALVFQAIFAWATYPMDWIEEGFSILGNGIRSVLADNWLSGLLVDGLLAGLSGVLIFIPQIAILFLFIGLLEESGYMARAVYLFDNLMSRFGLNGRSVVALISGGACAIPAIMSARNISHTGERLLTILVTPFISCSARIPVYAILVAFVVPAELHYSIFNAQGLVFMGLYLLGIAAALLSSLLFRKITHSEFEKSYLTLELPDYQIPYFRNIYLPVLNKVKSFVMEAGKIILIISLALWFLASYSFPGEMDDARQAAIEYSEEKGFTPSETADEIAGRELEVSFAGKLGKGLEPVIEPLGFDWKIGIALITSFAAREVFVGTMATIYSVGSTDGQSTISQKLSTAINGNTGKNTFTMPVSMALLVFYCLAMQCMSTLAVVKKETKSWKWPLLQFVYMTLLAYTCSYLTYIILS